MKKTKRDRYTPEKINCTPKKKRIAFEVSEDVAQMWEEIVCYEKRKADKKKRYYPAHTMEKLIRSRYDLLEAFGE